MQEIKKMSGDLREILMNFPEGIVLYDDKNQSVILANQEFKRIFNWEK